MTVADPALAHEVYCAECVKDAKARGLPLVEQARAAAPDKNGCCVTCGQELWIQDMLPGADWPEPQAVAVAQAEAEAEAEACVVCRCTTDIWGADGRCIGCEQELLEIRRQRRLRRLADDEEAAEGAAPIDFDTADDVLAEPAVEWAVPGLIPRVGVGVIFGEEYVGKSLLGLALGGSLSAGVPWLGCDVLVSGTVVVCLGEGRRGLGQRFRAMMEGHLGGIKPDMIFLKEPFPLTVLGAGKFLESLAGRGVEKSPLVLFDSKLDFLDGEENSNTDGQRMKSAMQQVSEGLEGFVACLDHSGNAEDAMQRTRGSSRFRQAMDVRLHVAAGVITAQKVKDALPPAPIGFEIRPVGEGESVTVFAASAAGGHEKSGDTSGDRALSAVRVLGPHARREPVMRAIRIALSCGETEAQSVLTALVKSSRIKAEGTGRKGSPILYSVTRDVR